MRVRDFDFFVSFRAARIYTPHLLHSALYGPQRLDGMAWHGMAWRPDHLPTSTAFPLHHSFTSFYDLYLLVHSFTPFQSFIHSHLHHHFSPFCTYFYPFSIVRFKHITMFPHPQHLTYVHSITLLLTSIPTQSFLIPLYHSSVYILDFYLDTDDLFGCRRFTLQ